MDNEDQRTRQASISELNQVSSDFAMAMALQEQERLANDSTIESDSSSSSNNNEEDNQESDFANEFFEIHDLQFLEEQESNSDDDDDDDDELMGDAEMDVDELTYEELIALGEFIGQEKRGLPLNEISNCFHACKYCYSSVENNKSGIDRCVICQVEYEEGESMVALLPCEHPYHSACISNWLQVKKICPICSTEVSPVRKNHNNDFTSKL